MSINKATEETIFEMIEKRLVEVCDCRITKRNFLQVVVKNGMYSFIGIVPVTRDVRGQAAELHIDGSIDMSLTTLRFSNITSGSTQVSKPKDLNKILGTK